MRAMLLVSVRYMAPHPLPISHRRASRNEWLVVRRDFLGKTLKSFFLVSSVCFVYAQLPLYFFSTRTALCPPNPKELFIATFTGHFSALLGT